MPTNVQLLLADPPNFVKQKTAGDNYGATPALTPVTGLHQEN
jgi:hypothetical protein